MANRLLESISPSKKRLPLPSNWRSGAFLLSKQVFQQPVRTLSPLSRKLQRSWPRQLWQVWLARLNLILMPAMKPWKMRSIRKFTSLSQRVRFTGSLNSTRPRKKFLRLSKSMCHTHALSLRLWSFRRKMRHGRNWISSCKSFRLQLMRGLATSIFLIQSVSRHQQNMARFSNTWLIMSKQTARLSIPLIAMMT